MTVTSTRSRIAIRAGAPLLLLGALNASPLRATQDAAARTPAASAGRDTVWIAKRSGTRVLEWSTSDAGNRRVVRWRSRPLGTFEPHVELRPITGARTPDLYWWIDDEQTVGAMIVAAAGDSARVAFASPADAGCRVPELRDVNGDGLSDVVVYRAGALSADECRGDALATPCADAYLTEWADAYVQQVGGQFAQDRSRARDFYRGLAARYARDATSLRRAIRTRSGAAAESPRCNAALAGALQRLARRAARVAG